MKRTRLNRIIAITLFALTLSLTVAAQDKGGPHKPRHHYQAVLVGTLGGPGSYFTDNGAYDINDVGVLTQHGSFTADADTPAADPFAATYGWSNEYVAHTFQWRNGGTTDLGALPGGGSSASTWEGASGLVAGTWKTGRPTVVVALCPDPKAAGGFCRSPVFETETIPLIGFHSFTRTSR
jgi:hypothetical protein